MRSVTCHDWTAPAGVCLASSDRDAPVVEADRLAHAMDRRHGELRHEQHDREVRAGAGHEPPENPQRARALAAAAPRRAADRSEATAERKSRRKSGSKIVISRHCTLHHKVLCKQLSIAARSGGLLGSASARLRGSPRRSRYSPQIASSFPAGIREVEPPPAREREDRLHDLAARLLDASLRLLELAGVENHQRRPARRWRLPGESRRRCSRARNSRSPGPSPRTSSRTRQRRTSCSLRRRGRGIRGS